MPTIVTSFRFLVCMNDYIGVTTMPSAMIDQTLSILDPPVYVVRTTPASQFVDKLELTDGRKWTRSRYIVVGKNQCTCLGWMKFKKCKHIDIVNDRFVGSGVGSLTAVDEATKVIDLLGKNYPEYSEQWKSNLDPDKLPPKVQIITFPLSVDKLDNVERIVSEKKIGKDTIVLLFLVSSEQ